MGYVVPDTPTPGNRVGALFNYWCSLINNDGFVVWEPHSGRKQP